MIKNCESCKFQGIDYEWDANLLDEVRIEYCLAGHDIELASNDLDCLYFQEYIQEKYVEKDSKCDLCENLQECISNGNCIFITMSMDIRNHYINGIGSLCSKKNEV